MFAVVLHNFFFMDTNLVVLKHGYCCICYSKIIHLLKWISNFYFIFSFFTYFTFSTVIVNY